MVLVSDTNFVFTGENRRREAFPVPFCAAIKHSWLNIVATTLRSQISAEVGIAAYTPEDLTEPLFQRIC